MLITKLFFLNKCNSSSLLSIFIKTHTKIALKVSGKGGGDHKHKKNGLAQICHFSTTTYLNAMPLHCVQI